MKIRILLLLALLLLGLLSLSVAAFETNTIINQMHSLALRQNQTAAKVDAFTTTIRVQFIVVFSLIGGVVIAAAFIVSYLIAAPIEWVSFTASQFLRAMQEISQNIQPSSRQNEIAVLNHAISVMTQQVREEFVNMEKQVKARTAELMGRTAQLETAAQIARESAAILDIDLLLQQTTHLISDRFGFYHVGIYLLDDAGEYVILQATNSTGGQRMLSKEYKLKIGQDIVGTVAARLEPRIASDVGVDATFFNNPDLPQTRSELAIPLKVRARLIGVLDVQSMNPEAYTEDHVRILQILADQLALAIENVRLLKESQRALYELNVAYGEEASLAWRQRLENQPLAYAYNRINVRAVTMAESGENKSPLPLQPTLAVENGHQQMTVPISIRGQALGAITLRRSGEQELWTQGDLLVLEDAVGQIASALENARLLEEIRNRAQQERLIGQIAAEFQSSLDLEVLLKTAVSKLGQLPGVTEAAIHIKPAEATTLEQ